MLKDYKFGNGKISDSTLIINMGSARKCPSAARGLCSIAGQCYAARDERLYPKTAVPYRDRQEEYWLGTPAAQMAWDIEGVFEANDRLLEKRWDRTSKATTKRKPKAGKRVLRWNESGDLHSMGCVEKLFTVAQLTPDVTHYMYTHRTDLVRLMAHRPKNVVIQISVDNQDDSDKYNALGFNTFFTDTEIDIRNRKEVEGTTPHEGAAKILKRKYGAKALICKWDCSSCALCKVQHGKAIHICLH